MLQRLIPHKLSEGVYNKKSEVGYSACSLLH
jgi:hypothetical protein